MLHCVRLAMTTHRYITRYNGQKGSRNTFCGWRLCMTRQKEVFVRYFTDREYETSEKSLAAALEMRDEMLEKLAAGCDFAVVCREYKKEKS